MMSKFGLEIEYVPIDTVKPYKNNAKKHPKWQVDQIASSIEEFGMDDPCGVKDNYIYEGCGRWLACKQLGYNEIPIIRLDHLTDEQCKAYSLIHNKLTMNSDFDLKILNSEMDEIFDIDMSQFGFDVDDIKDEWEDEHEKNKQNEQYSDANILQLEKAQFAGVGQFDIPEILPVTDLPEITEWIGFNYMLSEKNPEGKGVHCFVNDYQFERLWNNPDRYIEKLSQFACVASPDFSPYGDMPFCLQLFNHYRKHWVGRYLQESGVTLIPTIRASTDPRSKQFYLDGEPKGGAVIISSMWTNSDDEKKIFEEEYNTMFDTLQPNKVFLYGKNKFKGMRGNVIKVPTFSEKRWG